MRSEVCSPRPLNSTLSIWMDGLYFRLRLGKVMGIRDWGLRGALWPIYPWRS